MNNRADQIVRLLDRLTDELRALASTPRAKDHVRDLRTYLGFESGGYVGQPDICELLDAGEFEEQEDDAEDEPPCPECGERGCNGECTGHGQLG